MNRKFRRMAARGLFRITPTVPVSVYVVSKHNEARRLRFLARHKKVA